MQKLSTLKIIFLTAALIFQISSATPNDDMALAIHALVFQAEYSGVDKPFTRGQYDKLRWADPRPQPTFEELQAVTKEQAEAVVKLEQDAAILKEKSDTDPEAAQVYQNVVSRIHELKEAPKAYEKVNDVRVESGLDTKTEADLKKKQALDALIDEKVQELEGAPK